MGCRLWGRTESDTTEATAAAAAIKGFPSSSVVKESPAMKEPQEMQVQSLSWKDPLEEGMQLIPIFLPGESDEQYCPLENPLERGAWQATVYEVAQRWTLQK